MILTLQRPTWITTALQLIWPCSNISILFWDYLFWMFCYFHCIAVYYLLHHSDQILNRVIFIVYFEEAFLYFVLSYMWHLNVFSHLWCCEPALCKTNTLGFHNIAFPCSMFYLFFCYQDHLHLRKRLHSTRLLGSTNSKRRNRWTKVN